jgi:hypothetical protein
VLALLAPRGWLVSPSLSLAAPGVMLELAQEKGVDTLERQLLRVFNRDRCRDILNDCYDVPSFQRWRSKHDKALRAHRRGDYDVAIALWLIALEGIVRDELQIEQLFSKVRSKKVQARIRRELGWTHRRLAGVARCPD